MGINSPNTRNVSVTCLGYPFGNSTVFNHRSLLHGEKNMIVGLAIVHAYDIRNVGNILPMFLTPCIMGRAYTSTQNMTVHRIVRYDTRCYFNVRSKASQLNLPHGTDN